VEHVGSHDGSQPFDLKESMARERDYVLSHAREIAALIKKAAAGK
jgi:hypothetical protein